MRPVGSTTTALAVKNEHQRRVLEGVEEWASYYRSNIHRFVEDYFHIKLKLFQIVVLWMMDWANLSVIVGARGIGKSYLCAVYCCARAVLYPNTRICIAASTRGQSIVVLEKIMNEIRPNSPELAAEIDDKETKINNTVGMVVFRNTSSIKVVTASDTARSNRAHVLIIDEFRLVKKEVIDTVLRKFLAGPRHPKYLDNPKYEHLQEPNKTLYLSSAYYQDHWSYTRAKDSCRFMLDPSRRNFVCGFPYQLALEEDLLMREEVIEQINETDFNSVSWDMEMNSTFFGSTSGSFFPFDQVNKTRRITLPMLPDSITRYLPSATALKIPPKRPGEKRILSADIALMASTKNKNDATAIFINQLLPTKAGRYSNNFVYTESNEGLHTEAQALKIRKLYEEYDCDYIVLDAKNIGLGVYDALARDLSDPETGEVYPALSCCNNPELAARCSSRNAVKAVWAVMGSAKFNSDCALLLREGFRTGRIRLLVTEYEAEESLGELKGYANLGVAERAAIMAPYVNTTLLINELINLKHEESSGLVKISERSGMRKDRFSSLSYAYMVANQLEQAMRRNEGRLLGDASDVFKFRAPKAKEGWGGRRK